jgi:outer membrane murein-binding lipoprotein Lpp
MSVPAVVVLALVIAGCGGGGRLTKSQYEDKLQQQGGELSAAVQRLTQATTKDEFTDDVGDVQHALDSAADSLDGVTPPSDVAGANDRLVRGLRGLAQDFGRVKDAADQGIDAATLKARQITTSAASREAQQAIGELRRHGYDVGQLGT